MVMTADQAVEVADDLRKRQDAERNELDVIRRYWTGRQALPAVIPSAAPREVKEMARIARVNVITIVVESITQGLFADSVRAGDESQDPGLDAAWRAWVLNRMNRRQSGLYRAATAYGTAYMVATPGRPVPVMRPVSPRKLTAVYGDDDTWPRYGLERRAGNGWRLYDDEAVYPMRSATDSGRLVLDGEPLTHGAGVTPIVRYQDVEDLDLDDEAEATGYASLAAQGCNLVAGQVAPLIPLQDQINLTSFSLKAAEWYSAFRQRWAIGWTGSEDERMKAAASQLWTFDEQPGDLTLGEFSQTELRGYLESRQASLRYAATLSQTPVHELVGELVNLSAEALAAAEIGRDRKIDERKTGNGEAHEQTFQLVARYLGVSLPEQFSIVWRDTSARAFGAVVDGLGKLATMLQIPAQELWDRVPGATKADVDRWRKAALEGDPMLQLDREIERQAAGGTRSPGGIILPAGVTV